MKCGGSVKKRFVLLKAIRACLRGRDFAHKILASGVRERVEATGYAQLPDGKVRRVRFKLCG
jgi:hypothetical protein